jgi:hypothetical protein
MKVSSILFILGLILVFSTPVYGAPLADYRFQVEKNISHVYINKDGSVDIEYYITFLNYGKTIDVVDIGLPHSGYRLSSAKADIEGYPLTKIKRSSYIAVGVEVHLEGKAIPAGQKGTLHFRINNPKMIFPDTENAEYASMQFAPTWFGTDFTVGDTYLEVNVHFPPGVTGQETKYHYNRYTRDQHINGRLVFTWINYKARQKKQGVGVSFPRKYVEEVFDPSEVEFVDSTAPRRPFNWGAFLEWAPYVIILLIVVIGAIVGGITKRYKRMQYLPPETKIEGLGPRKDLEPAEAAIVMELPLSRVVALMLMQLVQKGCVEVLQVHPLRVNVLRKEGSDLKPYELSVLKALAPQKIDTQKAKERRLTNSAVKLIEVVRKKLKRGYSRKATADFYRGKIDYMWSKIEHDPQLEHLGWIALDEDCAKKVEENPARRRKLERMWEDNYHDFFRPRYRDRNFYYWLDDVQDDMVRDNNSFTQGVSRSTNPSAWIQSSSWSSGGGGGGFSCACACAGCACACAGGGR